MGQSRRTNPVLIFCFALATVSVLGCQRQMLRPRRFCPDFESAAGILSKQRSAAVPLKASGRGIIRYYDENNKIKNESFNVKLWVDPPAEFYMQADIAFDPKAVVLGSNEGEYWLAIRPKEVSSYWWGRWSGRGGFQAAIISPMVLLDAMGASALENGGDWQLTKEGTFAYTEKGPSGRVRKIYISEDECVVEKIEYLNESGETGVVVELGEYKNVTEDFAVPSFIKTVASSDESFAGLSSITLKLTSIKAVEFTEKQKSYLFTRRPPRGFKHVYNIVGGELIEQSQ